MREISVKCVSERLREEQGGIFFHPYHDLAGCEYGGTTAVQEDNKTKRSKGFDLVLVPEQKQRDRENTGHKRRGNYDELRFDGRKMYASPTA